MSEAAPAPSPTTDTSTPTPPSTEKKGETLVTEGFMTLGWFASALFYILFGYGAAKLSYDKYQSIGWAILNFFFATFYYPYYAIFLNGPSTQFGGRRRR